MNPRKKLLGSAANLLKQTIGIVIISVSVLAFDGPVRAQSSEQVAGGANHGIALKADGTVWTWGLNSNGQLGNGTTSQSLNPVKVASLSGITAIAAGNYHNLALDSSGHVWAWGINSNGELGDGTTTQRTSPVQVTALNGVTIIAISAGAYHSLALDSTHHVWAWGSNSNGQIGDGTTTQRNSPVQVNSLSSITEISAGSYHNLAINGSGSVYVWGYNNYGQLGDGTTTQHASPEQITGFGSATISAISAGAYHSLALTGTGAVWAWGYNASGEVGDGTLTERNSPVQVTGISIVTQICADGGYQSLAIKSGGTAWAWGYNWYGQCGLGSLTEVESPTQMSGISGAVGLGAGNYFTFVIKSDGTLWSCGYNSYGQLGNGVTDQRANAVQTLGLASIVSLSANGDHSLALDSGGTVWAFGMNGDGELGNNTTTQPNSPLSIISGITAIANGQSHSVALKSNQTVVAWGENAFGEVGDGTGHVRYSPVVVSGLSSITAISANLHQTLALKSDGTVWGWGANTNGQLGDGTTTQRNSPVQATGLSGVTIKTVAEGQYHSLAIDSSGHVWAWGMNTYGELGDGTTSDHHSPEQISGFGTAAIIAVSAGQYQSLALDNTGHVWAWGSNANGQLGIGSTTEQNNPVAVTSLSGITAISAGDMFSVALKNDGTVWTWGYNSYSQLGDGTTVQRTSPVQLPGLAGVKALAGGMGHSLALKLDGTVQGWGTNFWNDLGTGSNESLLLPIPGLNLGSGIPTPVVAITAPANNATVILGQTQTFTASASETGGSIAKVSYYIDAALVGQSTAGGSFSIVWSPPTWGNFTFNAIATDVNGNTSFLSTPTTVQVPVDSDGNGLPDWWELKYFGHLGNIASSDPDGNGLTLLQDYLQGNDPTNYYSQNGQLITPTLSIVSGNNQSSQPGGYAPQPLGIQVVNSVGGAPLYNAPVTFTADSSGGLIGSSPTDYFPGPTSSVRTNGSGSVQVYYQQPGNNNVTSQIVVATGTQSVTFNETANAPGPTVTPAAGTFAGPQTITVTSNTPNSKIYYTTDGSTPTTSSLTVVSGGTILISNSTVLNLIAFDSGNAPSNTTTALYLINGNPFAAGWNHSVLLKNDGTVWTWGSDVNGQLGDNSAGSQIPSQMTGISGALAVGAGDSHSLAVDSNGIVWAWGYNADGELGDGTQTQRNSPVQVQNGAITVRTVAVAGGSRHSLALGSDGSVWAWGDNSYGQLGTGDTTAHLSPVKITGLTNIVAIATHGWHNLALKLDGSVWAWGDNSYGQIGNGATATTGQLTPVQVLGAGSSLAIACGTEHSVALMTDGTVQTWGANFNGQLGNGTFTQATTPQAVSTLSGVTNITADSDYTIALQAGGSLVGWGNNNAAQLEQACYQVYDAPYSPSDSSQYYALCAGGQHALAVDATGNLWGWGNITGTGPSLFSGLVPGKPAYVSLSNTATGVTARAMSSRALLSDGTTVAWGQNFDGSLGDGTASEQNTPTLLANLSGTASIPGSVGFGLAVDDNGNAYSWGLNDYGQLGRSVAIGSTDPNPTLLPGLSNIRFAAAGYKDAFLVDDSGNIWGAGDPGALGLSGSTPVTAFTFLSSLGNVQSASLGQGFGLILKTDGTVWTVSGGTTTEVTGIPTISSICAAGQHAFAVDTSGNLWAWGDNSNGQLGNGSTTAVTIPVEIAASNFNSQSVVKVAGDAYSTMALTADGHVWAWGDNTYYQLGDGTTTQHLTPNQTLLVGKAIDIAMGYYHALAVQEDGSVVSWGTNLDGELGLGVSLIDGTPRQILGVGAIGTAPTISAPSAPPSAVPMGTSFTLQPTATASSGHNIVKVIFYDEGNEIGESDMAPFSFMWTPPTWGDFHFNFVAVDDQGLESAPLPAAYTVHVPYDSDGNGLPDWWELKYFGQLGNDPNSSSDGNGLTLLQDYQQGNDPTDYYSQNGVIITPVLTIISGNNETTTSGTWMSDPLVIQVSDGSGNILVNAPVTFTVTSGPGVLATSTSATQTSAALNVISDSSGNATVYFRQPLIANFASTIAVTAAGDPVSFTESTPVDNNPPAAPSSCVASIGANSGEIDLSWVDNADNASYLLIEQSTDNINWSTVNTIGDPTATSYAVTGLTVGTPYYFRISAGN